MFNVALKKTISIVMGFVMVVGNIAHATPAFETGKTMGREASQNIFNNVNPDTLNMLPQFGAATNDTSSLQGLYPGSGRDTSSAIGNLMTRGQEAANQNCAEDDYACKARSNVSTRSPNTAQYRSTAELMRSGVEQRDPLDVLGLSNPNITGGGQICNNMTVSTPARTEDKYCLDSKHQVIATFERLPVSETTNNYVPECIGDYTLSQDHRFCERNVFSCPEGGSLNGVTCTNTLPVIVSTAHTSPVCLDPTFNINSSYTMCNKTTYSCNPGDTLSGTMCTKTQSLQYADGGDHGGVIINSTQSDMTFSYSPNGANDIILNWGTFQNNHWEGSRVLADGVYNRSISFQVADKSMLTKFILSYAYFDDYIEVRVNGTIVGVGPDGGTQPLAMEMQCVDDGWDSCGYRVAKVWSNGQWRDKERRTNWSIYPNINVLPHIRTGSNTITMKVIVAGRGQGSLRFDTRQQGAYCPAGSSRSGNQCVTTYPATTNYHTATPGCLGGPQYQAGFMTNSGPSYVNGTQSGGSKTCISTQYTCPVSPTTGNTYNRISSSQCQLSYPATETVERVSPGCYTPREEIVAGQVVETNATFMTNSCVSTEYSCPVGLSMNGTICEDTSRMNYVEDPNCVNLGTSAEDGEEAFYCLTDDTSSCSAMNNCTLKSQTCVYRDEVIGSPSYNQCLAWGKTYSCPVPSATTSSTVCGYEPMCINGNCFEEEDHCAPLLPEDVIPTFVNKNTCSILVKEEFFECGVVYEYSPPDTNGFRHIIGAEPVSSCPFTSNSSCLMLPLRPQTDNDYGSTEWPTKAVFSCLGDTLNTCERYENNAECTLERTRVDSRQFSSYSGSSSMSFGVLGAGNLPGALPVKTDKDFSCEIKSSLPQDACSSDFGKVAAGMEASRQAGVYFDEASIKVFGGEDHFCHKRTAASIGYSFGSKDCCLVSAPDPNPNSDVFGGDFESSAKIATTVAAVEGATKYTYDMMMNSDKFYEIGASAWQSGFATDSWGASLGNSAELASGVNIMSYAGVSLSYAGSAAATQATYAGLSGTSTLPLGGGFQLQFSPVGFAVFAAIQLYSAYQAALACTEEDYKTATLTKGKLCYEYGSWCSSRRPGRFGRICTEYRTGKCCFNSKLARIINEQARPQLGLPINSCEGLTLTELAALDWSQIDLNEFIAEILSEAALSLPTDADIQQLTNKIRSNVGGSSTGSQGIDSLNHHP